MAGHDEDDDLFADLYGDEEETKAKEEAQPAPVPVPPPSVAPPLQGASATVESVPTQMSVDLGKASDPRLPPQPPALEPQQQQQAQEVRQEPMPVPTMPQMPQMPISQGPPQPSYNTKEDGKMFIGGLNWETTDDSLREYFEQYGQVTDCMVMRDGATGRSRGFGFLTFADAKSVNEVVTKEHYLDGKIIDPKRAVPRDEQEKTAKMFVGGVPPDCDEEQFSGFFGQFGRVVDATLMMDKDTGRPRGFGFVTFDSGEAVERAMVTPFLQINGKTIEVKRATPKGNQDRGNGRGAGTYNPNGGFGNQEQTTAAAYGGMTPAMMAQYYQRMQQWMAQMQAMGRGQAAQGMMGMNPMMNPMMMQQMQQQQQMQMQGAGQQGYGQQQQQAYGGQQGSASPYQGTAQGQDGQYDDSQDHGDAGRGDVDAPTGPKAMLDAPSGPARDSQYRGRGGGGYNRGGGPGGYQDRGGRGGGFQDRGRGGPRGRGGYRGASRFDPYSR